MRREGGQWSWKWVLLVEAPDLGEAVGRLQIGFVSLVEREKWEVQGFGQVDLLCLAATVNGMAKRPS